MYTRSKPAAEQLVFLLLDCLRQGVHPLTCALFVPAAYLVWSYSTAGRKGLQLSLLLVPRILIQVLAYMTTASFLGWLLFFKDEPAEYRLNQFLKPEDYPTVSLQLTFTAEHCSGHHVCFLTQRALPYAHESQICVLFTRWISSCPVTRSPGLCMDLWFRALWTSHTQPTS